MRLEGIRPTIDASSITSLTLQAKNPSSDSAANPRYAAVGGVTPADRTHVFLAAATSAEEFLRGKQNPDDTWMRRPMEKGAGNLISVFERTIKMIGPVLPTRRTGKIDLDEIIEGFDGANGVLTGPYARAVSQERIIVRPEIAGLWVLIPLVAAGAWTFTELKSTS